MQFIGIIPARYASTRFPGKPLVDIGGKSMIRRVYEQALKTSSLAHVVVATDDERIYRHVKEFGEVVYTAANHPSGTDRCFEAANSIAAERTITPEDVIVNIQGDEPFIHPQQIELLCSAFDQPETQIATLIRKIDSTEALFNENVVKVVVDKDGRALYFSRNPIPFCRGTAREMWLNEQTYFKHIGMYAYRMSALTIVTALPVSTLEQSESLEQLRWLENGLSVNTRLTDIEAVAIDTPEDLKKL